MEEAYLANLDEVVFQVCDSCFHDECYPLEISKAEFRRVATKNYGAEDGKMMTPQQVVRMLEIVNNTNVPKDK